MDKEKFIMILLELRANKSSFHPVKFNRNGISVILGRKESEIVRNKKKTYNSVGKSLTVRLIHFCLGCNPILEFGKKLPGWVFTLDFEIGGEKFTVSRATDSQNLLIKNGKNRTLNEFKKDLEGMLFSLDKKVKYLTYRSLISRFIRPKRSSYSEYNNFVYEEREYPRLINTAFLLGLDVERISKKYDLRMQSEKVDKLKKNMEKDPILKAFFQEDSDSKKKKSLDIEIVDLQSKVNDLSHKLDNFNVAENFYEIRKEADELSSKLRTHENQATVINNSVRNIKKSLEVKPDISNKKVCDLYNNAKLTMNDMVVKKVSEVEQFNKKLLVNRGRRLSEEMVLLEAQLVEVEKTIKTLGKKRDEKLQYLNTHGALDEYSALHSQKNNYEIKLAKLKAYDDLTSTYKNQLESIKIEFGQENILTNNYLKEIKPLLNENIFFFKKFVDQFYENTKPGIDVQNNDGQNSLRFDITAKIQGDTGDGISEVKIFCFDWLLLKCQRNHNMRFIFHDGRLLADMDPRQRATLFKLAFENTHSEDGNLQYIISANQDTLDSIKAELTPEEYQAIIQKNIILELTDKSHETKLLGIQVELDYEADEDNSDQYME
ncbi:MAG: DUF2326 domain-containing protein [Candidatus Omnitrophica bacterium]|nr:DUF2326 domain-containing protein [Candidatus Omnitrophota bacterium]